jgi:hypothetical protein
MADNHNSEIQNDFKIHNGVRFEYINEHIVRIEFIHKPNHTDITLTKYKVILPLPFSLERSEDTLYTAEPVIFTTGRSKL